MGADRNKVFLPLKGRPVLLYSLEVLESSPLVQAVVVITRREDLHRCREILGGRYSKVVGLVEGGRERQDSVYRGLQALPPETELVAVHDAARPLVDEGLLARVVAAAREWGGAVAAVPVRDTIKRDNGRGMVRETLVRQNLWAAQTPQVFRRDWLEEAYRRGMAEGWRVTDDASLVERCGYPVKLVEGDYRNLKITTPEDLLLAAALLKGKD